MGVSSVGDAEVEAEDATCGGAELGRSAGSSWTGDSTRGEASGVEKRTSSESGDEGRSVRRASGASGTERVGRGGRRESDLCIGEDDDEREKDGEEARKGVVGRRTAAGRQENASGTAEAVIASERHSHVKCPICASFRDRQWTAADRPGCV